MYINRLNIQNIRNLLDIEVELSPQINIIYGANGSGKTSLIEAIHLLSLGRSFRSKHLHRVINQHQAKLGVFAELHINKVKHALAISKQKSGKNTIRLNHQNEKNQSQLTKLLPIQLFNPESFSLLTGSRNQRCRLIDWGAFYSQPSFYKTWQIVKRLIKQRNASLKQGHSLKMINIWDRELIEKGTLLDQIRQNYVNKLFPTLHNIIADYIEQHQIDINYYRGWSHDISIDDALKNNFEYDLKTGVTNYGPHRADLKIRSKQQAAEDILSRGEQKLLILALKLAQGILFAKEHNSSCIYLIDDICSELDKKHLEFFLEQLINLNSQVIITCINSSDLNFLKDTKMIRWLSIANYTN